jgi:geranylgeranyl reductase family protein
MPAHSQTTVDAVVVGAGPAGAVAATVLARRGLRVALADKRVFPRDKVCGDFIGPHGLRELDEIGLGHIATGAAANLADKAAIYVNGKPILVQPLPKIDGLRPYGCVMPRQEFDERLFRGACAAGAEPLEGYTFASYDVERSGVNVSLRGERGDRVIRARALIGADGSASLVALRLRGRPQPRPDRIIAVRAYFEGVEGPADRVDLHFHEETFPGYLWVFPTGGGRANVGIGTLAQMVAPPVEHIRDMLQRFIDNDPMIKERLGDATPCGKIVGWPLSTYNGRLPIVADRVALAGDAAGFINPLNGEGIQYAIASGRWAAEAIAGALATGDVTRAALRTYARRVRREFGIDMAINRVAVQAIGNRGLNPVFVELLRTWLELAECDIDYANVGGGVVAGLVPTRRLFGPATVRKSLGSAFNSLIHVKPSRAARTIVNAAGTMGRHPIATLRWSASVAEAGVGVVREAARGLGRT